MINTMAFQFLSRELLVVAIAILVLFGGTRLPQIGRLMGRSLKEFRKGLKGAKDEFQKASDDIKNAVEGEIDYDDTHEDYLDIDDQDEDQDPPQANQLGSDSNRDNIRNG